jgi:hypothetical protein
MLEAFLSIESAWFFGGILSFIIISRLLRYGKMFLFANSMLSQCLKLLGNISADVAFAKTLKYKALEDSGMEEEQIDAIRSIDERAFLNWKLSTIATFIATFPKQYRGMLRFYDWDGAMKVLDDIYKREGNLSQRDGNRK